MFLVLHPKFSRQQVSASWEFLLWREKTSLLYCFIRDAIDPELKYNKNRKKSQETADKIGEKSEIKVSARGERTLRLKKSENLLTRTENFGFRIDATLGEKWSSSQHRRLPSANFRLFHYIFSADNAATRRGVGPRLFFFAKGGRVEKVYCLSETFPPLYLENL